MKTRREVDALKDNWSGDPVWDIETTEGFEEYHYELLQYRIKMENYWHSDYLVRLERFADKIGIPTNLVLAEYVLELRTMVDKLKDRLDQAEER